MKVERVKPVPPPEPENDFVITLTADEARKLQNIMTFNITIPQLVGSNVPDCKAYMDALRMAIAGARQQ